VVDGDQVEVLEGNIFDEIKSTGKKMGRADVSLLPPVAPPQIFGLGRNFHSHNREFNIECPDAPVIFFKPSSTLIANDQPIVIPHWATRVDYEGELGVVIGRNMSYVPESSALDFVFGYTCFNDVTERDIGSKGLINQDISKCCDTFGPCGPWISTAIDPYDCVIKTSLNDVVVQEDNTNNMVFSVAQVLSYLSKFLTLKPGDLVVMGTPGGFGPMQDGDRIKVEISGIGCLENSVTVAK